MEVDYDGDGHKQYAKLYWDVDVSDRKGTLNVWEKIYWKATGDSKWILLYATDLRTIKGNDPDGVSILIEGASHGFYDFRIEVLRENISSPDDFMDPSNNSELSNYEVIKITELKSPSLYFSSSFIIKSLTFKNLDILFIISLKKISLPVPIIRNLSFFFHFGLNSGSHI